MSNVSVPTPFSRACNSTLYYYDCSDNLPRLNQHVWQHPVDESVLSPQCKSVLRISVLYMMRISEILQLKIKHVVPPDRVIVYGKKNSNGYLAYLPGLSSQVYTWRDADKETKLFSVTYMRIYRACIKAGILINDGQGGNSMKTHAHRYMFARATIESMGSGAVKIGLHHKSIKSQGAYIKRKINTKRIIAEQTCLDLGEGFPAV